MENRTISQDILKIQKKLSTFEKDSRNYKKYTKILGKHIKSFTMKQRVKSPIKTIETVENMATEKNKKEDS